MELTKSIGEARIWTKPVLCTRFLRKRIKPLTERRYTAVYIPV